MSRRRLSWRAVVTLLVMVLAGSVWSQAPAKAATTQRATIYGHDPASGAVVASAAVTVTWSGPHTYSARMCLKDERRDGWGVRFQFSYVYASGVRKGTRIWSNDNGYGSTVCHSALVNWPPIITEMHAVVWATGAPGNWGSTVFPNPYTE